MFLTIYYISLLLINIVCITIFSSYINISESSFAPLFCIALMIFQGVYFRNNRSKNDFNVNNNSSISDKEWRRVSIYMSYSFLIFFPLCIPLVIFFNDYIKLLSFLIYILGFIGGPIYYRIKNTT